jgi:hypothetical protein
MTTLQGPEAFSQYPPFYGSLHLLGKGGTKISRSLTGQPDPAGKEG